MSSGQKRPADGELNKEDVDEKLEINAVSSSNISESNTESFKFAEKETIASRRIVKATIPDLDCNKDANETNESVTNESSTVTPSGSSSSTFGFLAYSKVNAFTMPTHANPFPAPSPKVSSTFPQFPAPSPNSQKLNPFSSPSPVHNPFMSFVDKKEEFWNAMSNPKSTEDPANKLTTTKTITPTFSSINTDNLPSTEKIFSTNKFNEIKSTITTAAIHSSVSPPPPPVFGETPSILPLTSTGTAAPTLPTESVTVINGEEGEECVFQVRARLYRLHNYDSSTSVTVSSSSISNESTTIAVTTSSTSTPSASTSLLPEGESVTPQDSTSITNISTPAVPKEDIKGSLSKQSEWVEVGTGPVRLLRPLSSEISSSDTDTRKSSSSSSSEDFRDRESTSSSYDESPVVQLSVVSGARLVMRREHQPGGQGTKLIMNILLRVGLVTVVKQAERAVRITCIDSSELDGKLKPVSYLLKTKHVQESDRLVECISALLGNDTIIATTASLPANNS